MFIVEHLETKEKHKEESTNCPIILPSRDSGLKASPGAYSVVQPWTNYPCNL
jgi:hypothetical protein